MCQQVRFIGLKSELNKYPCPSKVHTASIRVGVLIILSTLFHSIQSLQNYLKILVVSFLDICSISTNDNDHDFPPCKCQIKRKHLLPSKPLVKFGRNIITIHVIRTICLLKKKQTKKTFSISQKPRIASFILLVYIPTTQQLEFNL